MSDQYTPPRSSPVNPGDKPAAPRDEYTRTNIHVENPPVRPGDSSGGFGTGMLVAGVFVVIAIIAYVVFGDRMGSGPTADPAPSVSIENNNAAEPVPAPDAAPAAPAPAPDTGTVAPDPVAPDPVVPAPDAAPVAPANP